MSLFTEVLLDIVLGASICFLICAPAIVTVVSREWKRNHAEHKAEREQDQRNKDREIWIR